MRTDFIPEKSALYKPWQGKKRTSLISAHVLPRLRRVRFVFRCLRRTLSAAYPAIKHVSLFAGHHLQDEPFQYVATSVDLPVDIYAATCMEEFPVSDIVGVLAVELAQALCVSHYAEGPRLDWPAHMHQAHYRRIASDAFGAQIQIWDDGMPYVCGLLAAEKSPHKYPWLAPWAREEEHGEAQIEGGLPVAQQLQLGF